MSLAAKARSLLEDTALLLLIALLFPVGILSVETPFVLSVRAVVALAHRL